MKSYSLKFKGVFAGICVILGCCPLSNASSFDSLGTKKVGDQWFVMHEVEEDETLYSLSRRYGTKVKIIKNQNDLKRRGIDIGQILLIPIDEVVVEEPVAEGTHKVVAGETVYSISRKYGVKVQDILDWNDLEGTNISIDQILKVRELDVQDTEQASRLEEMKVERPAELPGPKYEHFVQPGETIFSISRKFKIDVDTLRRWNALTGNNLAIGQKLLIRKEVVIDSLQHTTPSYKSTSYGSRKWQEDEDGAMVTKEEGLVGIIEGTETSSKSLALHRDLPVGTEISILNLMNNKRIRAKVVGKLPNTGINRSLMLRLTAASLRQLGIIDKRSRVEISYMGSDE